MGKNHVFVCFCHGFNTRIVRQKLTDVMLVILLQSLELVFMGWKRNWTLNLSSLRHEGQWHGRKQNHRDSFLAMDKSCMTGGVKKLPIKA